MLVCSPPPQNLEVWRQLWRVLERSDVVVQVRTGCGLLGLSCSPWWLGCGRQCAAS